MLFVACKYGGLAAVQQCMLLQFSLAKDYSSAKQKTYPSYVCIFSCVLVLIKYFKMSVCLLVFPMVIGQK